MIRQHTLQATLGRHTAACVPAPEGVPATLAGILRARSEATTPRNQGLLARLRQGAGLIAEVLNEAATAPITTGDEIVAQTTRNSQMLAEVKARLTVLGRKFRDGVIKDRLVAGVLE